jgi:hypothetical protein
MKLELDGEEWELRWVRRFPGADWQAGDCHKARRRIRILQGLSEAERLRVVVHELLHALCWRASEERVDRTSAEIARVLRQLGYRRG